MIISEQWLREWVNPNLDTHALAEQLTMAGLEVDAVTPVAEAFEGVVVAEAIARSCAIKAEVVAKDEREGGLRAILNYGHTFGHAIEQVMGYGHWLHGEAVACGMVIATRISASRGLVPAALVERLSNFLEAFGLPVAPPSGMSARTFLDAMALDKKVEEGRIRYVLLDRLGRATLVNDVSSEEIARAIA